MGSDLTAACVRLRRRFAKCRWFRHIRVGRNPTTIFITSKTEPSPRRAGQIVSYAGFPVLILKEPHVVDKYFRGRKGHGRGLCTRRVLTRAQLAEILVRERNDVRLEVLRVLKAPHMDIRNAIANVEAMMESNNG